MNVIIVKMSDYKIGFENNILKTNSLGSCIGIVLYDKYKKIGGLAHIMLSQSPFHSNEIGKYANKAIPQLINDMIFEGCEISNLKAMLFGGAEMFFSSHSSPIMQIGLRNTQTSREILKEFNIPIIEEETGGKIGRTVELNCESGLLNLFDFIHNKKTFHFK